MSEPDMTNRELKIGLTGEFTALRTEMNGEFKLVREEIKTLQTEVHGEIGRMIGRMDARIDGQKTLVTGLLFPFVIAIAIPLVIYLGKIAWDMAELKIGNTIKKKNQPELELGNHPKH